MHLAMGRELLRQMQMENSERFLIGMLLPDAIISGDKKTLGTHYDRMTDSTHKVMDFYRFYDEFEDKMLTDSLYLGYYLHLIEDCIFRKYIYYGLGLLEMRGKSGFLEELYKDYHSVNGYIVKAYKITSLPEAPKDMDREDINRIYPFETDIFLREMAEDMRDIYNNNEKFFNARNADEVIRQCVEICFSEANALKRGGHYTSPEEYVWEVRM